MRSRPCAAQPCSPWPRRAPLGGVAAAPAGCHAVAMPPAPGETSCCAAANPSLACSLCMVGCQPGGLARTAVRRIGDPGAEQEGPVKNTYFFNEIYIYTYMYKKLEILGQSRRVPACWCGKGERCYFVPLCESVVRPR
jgi:hypothetical protein